MCTRRIPVILIIALCSLFWLHAPARGQEPSADVTADTRIPVGCTLLVTVEEEPSLSGSFVVDAKGDIQFTLTDGEGGNKQEWTVRVADKTQAEAQEAVLKSLKTYLKAPIVRLTITELPRIAVEMSGPVQKPGTIRLRPNARLSNALEICPPLPNADLTNIRILRLEKSEKPEKSDKAAQPEPSRPSEPPKNGEKPTQAEPPAPPVRRTLVVNFQMFLSGESEDDPKLEAGDKILLLAKPEPKAPEKLKTARVKGEVQTEGEFPIGKGYTVRDLLERAGGLLPTAEREKIILIRASNGRDYELSADRILDSDPVHNLIIETGDLLMVGKRDQSLIFMIGGEVNEPKTLPWSPKEKITLLQALELAGGPTRKADIKKGVLQRGYLRNPTQAQMVQFSLERIRKGQEPDWEIGPGDAIMLPPRINRPSGLLQFLPFLRFLVPFPF